MDAITRRFLIAPSFVRMIRSQHGFERTIEGHFPRQPNRNSYVRIHGETAELVLAGSPQDADSPEERTQVPRSHAEALLDVCAGAVVYERSTLSLVEGPIAAVDKMLRPQGVDLVAVTFADHGEAEAFDPPVWFGPEIGEEFASRAIALDGVAAPAAIEPTNAGLDALLDLVGGSTRRAESVLEAAESAVRPRRLRPLEFDPDMDHATGPDDAPPPLAEGEPAITSLRSIFAAQRPGPARERQRLPGE